MKNRRKTILVAISILVVLITIIGVPKLFINKKNSILPEVKLKEIEKSNTFAIMISNENGIGYNEYESNTWPNDNYKFKEAKCIDSNGKEVKEAIIFDNGKVTLTTDKTIYCTLYFDKPIITYLRNNDKNDNLSNKLQGEMYRYQGTKDKVDNNYICFGTTNKEECISDESKYMYRILGIDNKDSLELLKNTFIKEDNVTTFAWNDRYSIDDTNLAYCNDGKCPEWPDSILFKRLNGLSNGTDKGNGSALNKNWTDIFIDSEEYDYLKSGDNINGESAPSKWYDLIEMHDWMYGDTTETFYNGDEMYQIESGQKETMHYVGAKDNITEEKYKWPKSNVVSAKVSLMYIYDIIYSYYDGSNPDTRGNPNSMDNVLKSYLYSYIENNNNVEFLSTRRGMDGPNQPWKATSVAARTFNSKSLTFSHLFNPNAVRPVFFLKNTIQLTGVGTKDDPFIINFE